MFRHLALLWLLLFSGLGWSAPPITPEELPPALRPWTDWVLHDSPEATCPTPLAEPDNHICAWPARLRLELTPASGHFSQEWEILKESWVPLPGDPASWPQRVMIDTTPGVVIARQEKPWLRLPPGLHTISGEFHWNALPKAITIPPASGLLELTVSGQRLERPVMDETGRVWLREQAPQAGEEDSLDLVVQRRLTDSIPFAITTRIELRVAGKQRELVLDQPLRDGLIPMALNSPLPARLEGDGRLRLQVRPGHWVVELEQRHRGPLTQLKLPPVSGSWPAEEVWSFVAQPRLRLVELTGVPPVDPRQTTLPEEWKGFPTYLLKSGDQLDLTEKKRGDPVPPPDALQLERTWWLDFDGGGLTISDRIQGTLNHTWRLRMNPPLTLGRVAVNGEEQLITRAPGEEGSGVEVRWGEISVHSASRLEGERATLPTVGWDHDFQQVKATLNLPPGWRLFHVSGADHVGTTWINQWSLLDLFMVLVTAVAARKLWGTGWGVLVGVALVLIHQEESAITWALLHLAAASALLRVAPAGSRWQRAAKGYRLLTVISMIMIVLPFMSFHARNALHPQLEFTWLNQGEEQISRQVAEMETNIANQSNVATMPPMVQSQEESLPQSKAEPAPLQDELDTTLARRGKLPRGLSSFSSSGYAPKNNYFSSQVDPNAQIQTGPGLTSWQWRQATLSWNGPVQRDERIKLYLIPPFANRLLEAARVVLAVLLLLPLAGGGATLGSWLRKSRPVISTPALLLAIVGLGLAIPAPARAELPTPELLTELRERLLAPPECSPHCADLSHLELTVSGRQLVFILEAHAAHQVAIPLPGAENSWAPDGISVDGTPATALYRNSRGHLLLLLAPGAHQVKLIGTILAHDQVQILLPLRPHRVVVNAPEWGVEGIDDTGQPGETIQLLRKAQPAAGGAPADPEEFSTQQLPPLLQVRRTLQLGLVWQVVTEVKRLTPLGAPVVIELPTLAGESVTTPGVRVSQGRVLLNLGSQDEHFVWQGVLREAPELTLTAPTTDKWHEVWRLQASPIWQVATRGLPVVQRNGDRGEHQPEWQPWPGEQLTIAITRPPAVAGPTLTLEQSALTVTPGLRATDSTLTLKFKSSRSTQHPVDLPAGAQLLEFQLNQATQPITLEGSRVTLPIAPGTQTVKLSWRDAHGVGWRFVTPTIDLHLPGVNHTIRMELPRDRWLLWTQGPLLGPAVPFWGVLAVLLLVAWGLAGLKITPLGVGGWLLLGLGLSTTDAASFVIVAGWFVALGWKRHHPAELTPLRYNMHQLLLLGLSLLAILSMFAAIRNGLLGYPEMRVAGNGSSETMLQWYQDRTLPVPPQGEVFTIPLLAYRLLMLSWALWLAAAAVNWARWGWEGFALGGVWRSTEPAVGKGVAPPTEPAAVKEVAMPTEPQS